jgi:hypothetical protein
MYTYFDFKKIFESEDTQEMGAAPQLMSNEELVNYRLELQLEPSDLDALYDSSKGYVEKNEQSLVEINGDLSKNKTIDIRIINQDNAPASIPTEDPGRLVLTTTSTALGNIGVTKEDFTGIIETTFPSNRGEIKAKLSPAINVVDAEDENKVEIAKAEVDANQTEAESGAVAGANPWESRLFNFDQFVNENNKK